MSRGKRVLVVDDDESIRETVEMALEDEGYDARTVADGEAALALLKDWQPDVILLDMKMPVMDGWAFATAYRSQVKSGASLIVLTAAQDALRWAEEIQADDVLPKPFELDDLFHAVRRHTA